MNRVIIVLLVVVSTISAGNVFLAIQERNQKDIDLARLKETVTKLEKEIAALRDEAEKLRVERQRAVRLPSAAGVAGASEGAVAGNTPPAPGPGKGGRPGAGFADMLKSPEMREMVKQQQIAQLDMQYGGLIARFGFDDAEKANFKQLLGERLGAEFEIGLKMMDTSLTKEQRRAVAAELEAAHKASDEKMRFFLNDEDDFAAYKNWEDTKGERMQIEMGRGNFSSVGEPLSPDQEQQLVNVLHETNSRPSDVPDMSKPENFDPTRLTDNDIAKQLASYDRKAEAVAQQAAAFLSEKQMQALREAQKQWRAMAEMGMKMSAKMFEGAGK
jgi:hypothetical protein